MTYSRSALLSACLAGLALTLGGAIGFETRPGVGTTFHFELQEWRKDSLPRAR